MPLAFAKMVKTVVPVRKAPAALPTPPGGEALTVIRPALRNVFCLEDIARVTESLDGSVRRRETNGVEHRHAVLFDFLGGRRIHLIVVRIAGGTHVHGRAELNTKLTTGLPIGLPFLLCLRKVNRTCSPVIVGDEDVPGLDVLPVPVVPDSLMVSVLIEGLPRAAPRWACPG